MNLAEKIPAEAAAAAHGFSSLDRALRSRLIQSLQGLRHGRLMLEDDCGRVVLGEPASPELNISLQVVNPLFYRSVAVNGSVGAGEAYLEGYWRCDDLVGLLRLLLRNRDLLDRMESGLARLGVWALRGWGALRHNSRRGSRKNIAAHYDLGNEFFRLFLSADLMYSSAIWVDTDETLCSASTRKLELICRKLDLRPSDRLIEIGTGWGGFAIHAAKNYGCHVTTTTISQEQYALARERISQEGLADRVEILCQDYRDLRGRYDKLVSIEMIEAIGGQYLDTYFAKIGDLLEPGGTALVQAITIEDHRYEAALHSVDFIKRYVFPGSFIPSLHAIMQAKTRVTNLALLDMQDFGLSYARTLWAWRGRFLSRLPEVRRLGFDDRFIRLWEFYLAYCEGGFREKSIGVAQLLFAKPGPDRSGAANLAVRTGPP